MKTCKSAIEILFQSTRPRGRDSRRRGRRRISRVSIHAPARARPLAMALAVATAGFNPRAREGRDHNQDRRRPWPGVSIHAPARARQAPGGG